MKNSKSKFIMPVMAIAFAVAGAFATNAANEKPVAQVTGYIDAPEPCQIEVQCSDVGSILCTNAQGERAFGKVDPSSTTCPITLYRL